MNIKHPELLFLFALIPLAIGFYIWIWQRRKHILYQLCDFEKLKNIFPNSSNAKSFLRYFLVIASFSMIVLALISPRWGYEWVEVNTEGTNIIVALDVSKSMLADDISPSRLARAKLEINKLIDKLTGDRLGLIIFAGDSFLQSPLTHDYLMVKDWLSAIDVNSVPRPGTSIRSAIATAREAFSFVESDSKALIIISDGEEQDEETVAEAKAAKSEKIAIYSIGVGTQKGAPIKVGGQLIKNSKGEVVVSKLDDGLLKDVAKATDGEYLRSTTGDFHLDQLYYEYLKKQVESESLKSGKTRKWFETFQVFCAIALAAILLEFLLSLDLGIFNLIKRIFNRNKENIFAIRRKK